MAHRCHLCLHWYYTRFNQCHGIACQLTQCQSGDQVLWSSPKMVVEEYCLHPASLLSQLCVFLVGNTYSNIRWCKLISVGHWKLVHPVRHCFQAVLSYGVHSSTWPISATSWSGPSLAGIQTSNSLWKYCTILVNSAVTHHGALPEHWKVTVITLILTRCRKHFASAKYV